MSKRINRQMQRRQVRRALKIAGDSVQQIGNGRLMRAHYGQGLTRKDVRGEDKAKRNVNEELEFI